MGHMLIEREVQKWLVRGAMQEEMVLQTCRFYSSRHDQHSESSEEAQRSEG
jgi:hypothetical protein